MAEEGLLENLAEILAATYADTTGPVVLVPVRHHSPACSRAILTLIDRLKPAQVLIEGPSDFNPRLSELDLPHRLPLAIYTWVRLEGGQRLGCFYPFCSYSPEWVAFKAAREKKIPVSFIDLPWHELASADPEAQGYTDADLRRAHAIDAIAKRFGVGGFDAVWDALVEVAPMAPEEYLRRAHTLCSGLRLLEGEGDTRSQAREIFMVARIQEALEDAKKSGASGPILVVTGGYHSPAIAAGLAGAPLPVPPAVAPLAISERGQALTPFSYRRLDALTGYDAGMPGPAFYQRVWDDRRRSGKLDVPKMVSEIALRLRQRKQAVSTADLIALRLAAEGLATLRGHHEVWRDDLLDAAQATLIKEDLPLRGPHPIRAEIDEVFRGGLRGALAEGSALPPLVNDLRNHLEAHGIEIDEAKTTREIDLAGPGRSLSQFLHRLRVIGVDGFVRVDGTDFANRTDLTRPWERWSVAWTPEGEGRAIEAASLGASVADAAVAALMERLATAMAASSTGQAAAMGRIVLEGELCGLPELAARHSAGLEAAVGADSGFLSLCEATATLLHLYRFDQVLGSSGKLDLGRLLGLTWERALWQLDQGGSASAPAPEILNGLRTLVATWERCGRAIGGDLNLLDRVFSDLQRSRQVDATVRGGVTGGRWTLGLDQAETVLATLKGFCAPEALGDFLTGVFALAREAAQRRRDLLAAVEHLVDAWDDDEFLVALPSMRLSFVAFPPRELHHLAATIQSIITATGGAPDATTGTVQGRAVHSGARRFSPEEMIEGARQEETLMKAAAAFGLSMARWRELAVTAPVAAVVTVAAEQPVASAVDAPPVDAAKTDAVAPPPPVHSGDVRRLRWRMILGTGAESVLGSAGGAWGQRDTALDFLYRREIADSRNQAPLGASLDASRLTIPDWINQVHALFPKRTIERLEKDALERYHLDELVTNPELLKRAEPNEGLLRAILQTKHLMNQEVLALARDLVRRVIAQLMEKLAVPVRQPFTGVRQRRPSSLRVARNFDARTTVRRNLAHWDVERKSIVIRTPCFISRVRRHSERWQVVVLVDESGSMADNVIHSAVTAAILVGLPNIRTHLVLFDTKLVDVTDHAGDPVEVIMKVQLGGGTDIAQALVYAESLITNPRKAMVVLVSDFCEGGGPTAMLASIRRMVGDGTHVLGLAALNHDADPAYDREMASRMVAIGAHVGAMTPGELAGWIAQKVG